MYKLNPPCILRLSDNARVPIVDDNGDYQQYLAWLAEGNTPEAADLPDPKIQTLAAITEIEATTGVVRVVREGLLRTAEFIAQLQADQMTAAGTSTTRDQLLSQNIGYQRALAIDNQIRLLREQIA